MNNHPIEESSSSNALAAFGLLFGAMCWGIIWFPYRLLSEAGVSGVVSSFYTYSIAIIIAGVYFFKYWRQIFNLPVSIVWLGIVAGWTNLSYVLAIIDGEVMRVMLLFYLSPLWTLVLAHFWLKEKTTLSGYMAITASLIGAFIMLHNPQLGDFPLPRNTPEWLALSSGIGFSLTNVITRKSTHLSLRAKSFAVWFGVLILSFIFMLLEGSDLPSPDVLNATHWLLLLLIAILLIAATLFVQYGVSRIPATRASVLFLFELVVAAVAAYYLAHESMSVNEWIGGGLIVIAAVFAASHEK